MDEHSHDGRGCTARTELRLLACLNLNAGACVLCDDHRNGAEHGVDANVAAASVTSQLPVDHWHEAIANPTIADAILDRLVHNAHRLTLKGESMRKTAANRAGLAAKQDA